MDEELFSQETSQPPYRVTYYTVNPEFMTIGHIFLLSFYQQTILMILQQLIPKINLIGNLVPYVIWFLPHIAILQTQSGWSIEPIGYKNAYAILFSNFQLILLIASYAFLGKAL